MQSCEIQLMQCSGGNFIVLNIFMLSPLGFLDTTLSWFSSNSLDGSVSVCIARIPLFEF